MRHLAPGLALAILVGVGSGLSAQTAPPTGNGVGVITQGSGDVSVGGQPAARKGDVVTGGDTLVEGSSNVFINGKPAVTVGGRTGCGGATVSGSSNVFVNGKPLARAGDITAGCPEK